MRKPRVLLADDHILVMEGLRSLLTPHVDLVGAVADGEVLVEEAVKQKPDIVLVDIAMPRLNGIEAARRLRKLLPKAKIIFVTQHSDAPYVAAARKMGAAGYVLKQSAASELLQAIEAVKSGRRYFATPVNRVPRDSLLAGGSRLRAGIQEYAGEDRAAGVRARRPKQDSSE